MRKLSLLLGFLCAVVLTAAEYRIEAENFPEKGEWKPESCAAWKLSNQRMLDPKGAKSATAKTTVALPEAGRYCFWVRAVSFGGALRQCRVLINGKSVGTFGDRKTPEAIYPIMVWEKALKKLDLPAGDVTIELVSLNPFTRVDALILTTDNNFVPANEPAGIEAITELAPTAAAVAAGKAEAAKPKPIKFYERGAKDAPAVLLFHGQRVWTAEESAKILASHGLKVTAVTTANLDGLGGASLKTFLTDLGPEPLAQDGITPAFAQLGKFKAVVFTALPAKNWEKFFTPERVAQLKKYVADGGVAIFNADAPAAVAELLPVQISGKLDAKLEDLRVEMPRTDEWNYFPEKWQPLQTPRETFLKENAVNVLPIGDIHGKTADTMLAEMPFGKGKVLFFNFNWSRTGGLKQYWDWGYGPQLLAAIVSHGLGVKPNFSAFTANSVKVEPRQLDEVSVKIEKPNNALNSAAAPAQVVTENGVSTVKFASGATLVVSPKGAVKITYPDGATVEFAAPPKLQSVELVKLTSDTSEGVGDLTRQKAVKEKFELKSVVANSDGTVDLLFQSEKSEFVWQFKSGELILEGRSFPGVAHRLIFSRSENKLQSFQLPAQVVPGTLKGAVAKRLACYASPRGYVEMDFSGAKKATTSKWNFFGNGQPFTWLVSDAGIYSMFPETPQLVQATQTIDQGADHANELIEINVGRRSAPLTTAYLWHVFSPGAERGHADYIALEQFMRTLLQSAVGLKNLPPAPVADCENTLTNAERKQSMAAAKELGFRYYHLPLCPSSIESMKSEARKEAFEEIKSYGLIPQPWTAADYCEGNSEEVFRNHPDYFLRTADGNIYKYFGNHPVLDMNNPETRKWYFDIMNVGIANGLGKIYTDMGGTFTINVNAAGEESKIGLDAAIEIYRYFHDHNIPVSIEGITPLALSNFWYRRQLYEPFAGREYAVIGTQFGASGANAFDLGYFRLVMYCTFAKVPVSGYALDFERFPNEKQLAANAAALIRQVQPLLDKFGMPYVREVECGTTWVSPNGAAVFCFDGVKKLTVEYNGKTRVFTDVKPETVIELD